MNLYENFYKFLIRFELRFKNSCETLAAVKTNLEMHVEYKHARNSTNKNIQNFIIAKFSHQKYFNTIGRQSSLRSIQSYHDGFAKTSVLDQGRLCDHSELAVLIKLNFINTGKYSISIQFDSAGKANPNQ